MKMAKSDHFCIQPDTPTPRQRSLHLGEPEPKFFVFFGQHRRSIA